MTRLDTLVSRLRSRAARRASGDGGFVLLESMIAITLITLLAAALGTFFVNGVSSTNQQRAKQFATQIADSAVESLRSIPASDVVAGRDATSVAAQFAAASSVVAPWVSSTRMTQNYADANAATDAGKTATVPTVPVPVTMNGKSYNVSKYVGLCATLAGNSADCTAANETNPPSGATVVHYIRAVVAVEWTDSNCRNNTCTFVTATLLTATTDPTFNLNQNPPVPPVVVSPANQTSMVGAAITPVTLAVKDNTGVPTYTWGLATGSTLPAGLTLDPTGVISGTPTAAVTNQSVTVTVLDSFLRKATATFTWTVLPALTPAKVADQSSAANAAITPLTLTATGGTGAPYTWSDPNGTLPPGLTLNASTGKISGTPALGGTYPVVVTVTDSGSHSATVSWTWTVSYAPLVPTTPSPRTDTVNLPASLQLTANGGSGQYTWTVSGLPTGITATSGGLLSGTPTKTGASTVSATVTDTVLNQTRSLSFTWTVTAAPTVSTPGAQTTTVGANVSVPLTTTCPNGPCSYKLNNGPAGLTAGAGGITGTVTSSAQVFSAVSVTVTDADNASVTSGTFKWTVNPAPSITTPAAQYAYVNTPDTLAAPAVSGGTGSFTWTAAGLPGGLSIDSDTGQISGVTPTKSGVYTVTISATDAAGVAATTNSFKWYVSTLNLSIPDQWATPRQTVSSVSIDLDTFATGGAGSNTYKVTGLPSWLTTSTGNVIKFVNSTAPSAESAATITVTATDSAGAQATTSFHWYVSRTTWSVVDAQYATGANVSVDLDNYLTTTTTVSSVSLSGATGLSYNASSHVISGKLPTTPTVLTLVATATESSGFAVVSRPFTWTVSDLSWSSMPTSRTSSYNTTITPVDLSGYAQKGSAPYLYSATNLPAGLSIDSATGVISGRPSVRTTYSTTVTITDSQGATATTPTITWKVN